MAAFLLPLLVAEVRYWIDYRVKCTATSHVSDYTGWDIAFTLVAGIPCVAACLVVVGVATYRARRRLRS